VPTNLLPESVRRELDAIPSPPPPPPPPEGPAESELPKPFEARVEPVWGVRVGQILSAQSFELSDLIDACSGLAWVDGQLVAAHAHATTSCSSTPTG
jgi:hypothetical protein